MFVYAPMIILQFGFARDEVLCKKSYRIINEELLYFDIMECRLTVYINHYVSRALDPPLRLKHSTDLPQTLEPSVMLMQGQSCYGVVGGGNSFGLTVLYACSVKADPNYAVQLMDLCRNKMVLCYGLAMSYGGVMLACASQWKAFVTSFLVEGISSQVAKLGDEVTRANKDQEAWVLNSSYVTEKLFRREDNGYSLKTK
ncbi:hypothetical protein VNO80_30333 [Phaseolus coccineus]|uniref:Uncharacterized protein n=1 Tax=Phaseolus coccineus TaxID=3886 RepID=A0AAN9QJE7_PHACN